MKLDVQHLTGGYGRRTALEDVSFSLETGKVLWVLGPNGSGKSTLFRTLLGLQPRKGGQVLLDGQDTGHWKASEMARYFSYIPQSHTPVFDYPVEEVVLMGRVCHLKPLQSPGKADRELAMKALEQMGGLHLAGRPYTALSGGERQLVLIARTLCQQARFVVMDEPASDLDYARSLAVWRAVRALTQQGCGVMLSSHAPENPLEREDRLLLLREGKMVAWGTPDQVLTPGALEAAYGVPMEILETVDHAGRKRRICVARE